MDPHSRLSQFNQRPPKAKPFEPVSRHMDLPQAKSSPSLKDFMKRPGPSCSASASTPPISVASRLIATNSRVKQNEQLRKDMHLAFVNNALQEKTMGKTDNFNELVDQFNLKRTSNDHPSPIPQLRLWILALTHVVSRLERTHAALVESIVRMPWMTMDSNFVKSYTSFIGILVSARPEYLSLVLGKVAQGFTYQSGLQALEVGLPESSSAPLTRRVVYDRIHYLLRHLLSLVPTLPSTLQPLLYRNFPHKRQNRVNQVAYIRNMLRVMEYCPEIADKLLSSIIDRAIQIDVEIQVELEELEAVKAIQEQTELFELDPFDTVVGQEESADESGSDDNPDIGDNFSDLSSEAGEVEEDDPKTVDAPLDVDHIHDMVGKLDSILKLIFDHFSRASTTPSPDRPLSDPTSRTDSPSAPPDTFGNTDSRNLVSSEDNKDHLRTQFHTLLAIFDRTILRTFKSRYTQFLLFWYASLDPEFSDTFQGELVSKALLEADQPAVTRAAAASYIASFVSRATFVDRESARSVVRILCEFLRSQLDLYEMLGSSVPRHAAGLAPFNVTYAVVQAVFLIFCFRWRDLMEDEDEELDEFSSSPSHGSKNKWMDALAVVQRIVNSALNPLKFCSENVVLQFARVAQATGFVYVYPIIEANRRFDFTPSAPSTPHANGASTSSVHSSLFGNNMLGELNTFFPFDPYKLPKTSSYIEGVYREWSAVAIDDDEEEEEEEEDEEGHQKVPTMSGRPISGAQSSQDRETETLGASFGGMSISPASAPVAGLISIPT